MVAAQDGAMDGFAVTVNVMFSVTVSLSMSVSVSAYVCVCPIRAISSA